MMEKEKPDIQEVLFVEDPEQLQVLADPIRYQIASFLASKPMTGAQLARALKISRPRAHYHLKLLLKAGLVFLWDEDSSSGIVEKYYRSIAQSFNISRLFSKPNADPNSETDNLASYQATIDYLATALEIPRAEILNFKNRKTTPQGNFFDFSYLLTPEQIDEINQEIIKLEAVIEKKVKENYVRLQNGETFTAVNFRSTIFLTLLSDAYQASQENSLTGPQEPTLNPQS